MHAFLQDNYCMGEARTEELLKATKPKHKNVNEITLKAVVLPSCHPSGLSDENPNRASKQTDRGVQCSENSQKHKGAVPHQPQVCPSSRAVMLTQYHYF